MTRFLLAGAAALGLMTGAAVAQSSGHSSTIEQTTTIMPPVSGPSTATQSTSIARGATPDGDQTATAAASSGDSSGATTGTTITNTSYPLNNVIRTTKTTTTVANGVATETVTTTDTYPASYMREPSVAVATRTYVVGAK